MIGTVISAVSFLYVNFGGVSAGTPHGGYFRRLYLENLY